MYRFVRKMSPPYDQRSYKSGVFRIFESMVGITRNSLKPPLPSTVQLYPPSPQHTHPPIPPQNPPSRQHNYMQYTYCTVQYNSTLLYINIVLTGLGGRVLLVSHVVQWQRLALLVAVVLRAVHQSPHTLERAWCGLWRRGGRGGGRLR